MKREIIKWAAFVILVSWGFASFIFVISEAETTQGFSLGLFMLLKMVAILSFFLCMVTGRWLSKKNLLPIH